MISSHLQSIDIDIAAHQDEFLRQRRKLRIAPHGEGDIRQGASRVDRHLMRVLANHLDHEVHTVRRVIDSCAGESLDEGPADDAIRVVTGAGIVAARLGGSVLGCEGALEGEVAVDGFPGLEAMRGVDQGPGGAGVDGDAGEVGDFEVGEGV